MLLIVIKNSVKVTAILKETNSSQHKGNTSWTFYKRYWTVITKGITWNRVKTSQYQQVVAAITLTIGMIIQTDNICKDHLAQDFCDL